MVLAMKEMLMIRKSSELFRLRSAKDVMHRLEFHNTGPDQVPGLIVMSLRGDDDGLMVLFNATPVEQAYPYMKGGNFILHPVQQDSLDPVVKTAQFDNEESVFHVPARTTAVFILQATGYLN